MATDTDIRLRSYLDANQRDREQMCRSVLALNPHFTDVRPRHPLGGPDGGRDMEAILDTSEIAFGAVGFINGANDSEDHLKRCRTKFSDDLRSALSSNANLKVFVFFTNLHLTISEKSGFREEALSSGIISCEIYDRERLRIELDSPSGFFIRFQYLGIPLSEAEQASFLAQYGDRVQEVVSTGFQKIEKALSRLIFLAESGNTLDLMTVHFSLKKSYTLQELGDFRAFLHLSFRAVKHDILSVWFGSVSGEGRFAMNRGPGAEPAANAYGISSGQWEQLLLHGDEKSPTLEVVQTGSGQGGIQSEIRSVRISYRHDQGLVRLSPRLDLKDLDDCMYLPILSKSFAEKVVAIAVFANGYKLAGYEQDEFYTDASEAQFEVPGSFTPAELSDPWVRIRPNGSSIFQLRFHSEIPRRLFDYREI